MFYVEPDMAAYAERARPIAAPGTRWHYSSASTHLVARVVRDAVGGTGQAVQEFARHELFAPLGMEHVTLEMDASGTPIGAHYMLASARDWARLGWLYAEDGMVGGRRILPPGWARWSATPTLDTDYGAGFWTNQGQHPHALARIRLGLPAEAFFASGNLGQRIAIIPSEHLVIVRTGHSHGEDYDMEGFLALVRACRLALGTAGKT
jgi:CubicO group peptidase (beta-lactamase class C family)